MACIGLVREEIERGKQTKRCSAFSHSHHVAPVALLPCSYRALPAVKSAFDT